MKKDAGRLQCPSCGVPVANDAVKCQHCGTRLATVSCPSCFGMVFEGTKFCGHCGASLQRSAGDQTNLACPKCKSKCLAEVKLGQTPVHECAVCHGLWVAAEILDQICADRERHSAVLGSATKAFRPGEKKFDSNIRYVPCPICAQLMHRLNFAKSSGVVVDVCRGHGTWFDRDELQHIVHFIRGGGLDRAREKEKAELEAERRRLQTARTLATPEPLHTGGTDFRETDLFDIAGLIVRGIARALD